MLRFVYLDRHVSMKKLRERLAKEPALLVDLLIWGLGAFGLLGAVIVLLLYSG